MSKFAFSCILVILILHACKTKVDDNYQPDFGYNYYPLAVNAQWIYNVDSIVYDNNTGTTTIDTFNYQYREKIDSSYTDSRGKPVFILRRYFRPNDTSDWNETSMARMNLDDNKALKTIDNTTYVKLLFPVRLNALWNGNMFNNNKPRDYTLAGINETFNAGGNNYPQTARVIQYDEVNAIEEIKKMEIYAQSKGMVYLLSDSINSQPKPGGGFVSRGLRYRLTLKSYSR
jgi:hypothetical protein